MAHAGDGEPVFLNVARSPEIVEAELEVARVAYDLGADIIKITFPGPEATAKLVAELDIPVVVAGGPLSGDATSTLKDVTEAIQAGAQGVVVGRKVWQRPGGRDELAHRRDGEGHALRLHPRW